MCFGSLGWSHDALLAHLLFQCISLSGDTQTRLTWGEMCRTLRLHQVTAFVSCPPEVSESVTDHSAQQLIAIVFHARHNVSPQPKQTQAPPSVFWVWNSHLPSEGRLWKVCYHLLIHSSYNGNRKVVPWKVFLHWAVSLTVQLLLSAHHSWQCLWSTQS